MAVVEALPLVDEDLFPTHLKESCRDCGLWKTAKSPCISGEVDTRIREELSNAPYVLIIGQGPGEVEDALSRVFCNPDGAGGIIRQLLDEIDIRWLLGNVTQCFPGKNPDTGRDNPPSDQQAETCFQTYVWPWARKYDPQVILCLGEAAMRGVLGKKAPKTLKAARGKVFISPDYPERYIVIDYHPVELLRPKKEARVSVKQYIQTFDLVRRLAFSGFNSTPVEYETILTEEKAMTVLPYIGERIVLDVETEVNENVQEKLTFWHPKAKLLSIAVTWRERDAYKTVVFARRALTRAVVESILSGRRVGGHNFKYDLQVLYRFFKLCAYKLCKEVFCSMHEYYLEDQDTIGIGLKNLCQIKLGIPPWDGDVWKQIDTYNAAISDFNKKVALHNRRVLAVQKRIAKGEWIPPDVKAKLVIREPLPPDTGDFGIVTLNSLLLYNASDTHNNFRLIDEDLAVHPENEKCKDLTKELVMSSIESLSRLERRGLPMSVEVLAALKKANEDNVRNVKLWLYSQPVVREALAKVVDVPKYFRSLQKTGKAFGEEDVLDWVTLKASSFYQELVKLTHGEGYLPYTDEKKKSKPAPVEEEDGEPAKPKKRLISSDKVSIYKLAAIRLQEDDEEIPLEGTKFVSTIPESDRTSYNDLWFRYALGRESADLISKYLESYPKYILNGRVHTDFITAKVESAGRSAGADGAGGGAGSGRVASRNPNIHNIKKDKLLRRAIRAKRGWKILEFDYDRIEPVVLSVISDCKAWKDLFFKQLDLYRVVANRIYGYGVDVTGDPAIVTPQLIQAVPETVRDVTKTGTLALMYKQGEESFAARTGVPLKEVEKFFQAFRTEFPEIIAYMEKIEKLVNSRKPIENLFGRRRVSYYLGGMNSSEFIRSLNNFPVQGTASDITLWKMRELFRWIDANKLENVIFPFNGVHDALWFEVREEAIEEMASQVAYIMEDMRTLPFVFDVPLLTTAKAGPSLGELSKFKFNRLNTEYLIRTA